VFVLDVRGLRASDHVVAAAAVATAADDDAVMMLQTMDRDGSDSTSHHRRL